MLRVRRHSTACAHVHNRRLQKEKAKIRADLLKDRTHITPPLTELPAKVSENVVSH